MGRGVGVRGLYGLPDTAAGRYQGALVHYTVELQLAKANGCEH